ncbi:MAG: hypothetical protein JWM68_1049 [Verrucomicrobiales bacterium]|nr:hypothetical protein [Verrucomicrobiales bacterium]
MNFEEVINAVGKKMVVDFDDISSNVTHRGAKGRIREQRIITDYLEKYLPGNIGIGNGEIVASNGVVSQESDIILYDKFTTPFLLKEECYQVFPIECVYGVLEIKSNLDQRELIDAEQKLKHAKLLPKVAFEPQSGPVIRFTNLYGRELPNFPVIGLVFAYDSIDLRVLADYLNTDHCKLAIEQRIDSVWVLKRGMIVPFNMETKMIELTPGPNTVFIPIASENPLLLLTLHLQTLMSSAWMSPFRIRHYLKTAVYGQCLKYALPSGSLSIETLQKIIEDFPRSNLI